MGIVMIDPLSMKRREFLAASVGASLLLSADQVSAADAPAAHLASGIKVGEVTDRSAIVWARLTAAATRVDGLKVKGKAAKADPPKFDDVDKLDGACPGAAGRLRLRYGLKADLSDAKTVGWVEVGDKTDFMHQFAIDGLQTDSTIHFAIDTAEPGANGVMHGSLAGSFRTAPAADKSTPVTFAIVTCQGYTDIDHADGFHIYPSIAALDPRFVAFTGDNVYYDSEQPIATSAALARYHWQRMYSLPRHIELLGKFATYWEKDDHDTLKNDSWPGSKAGSLTFAQGQAIFREQVPMSEKIYRTFRWGKHLQIWLTDGRDFRSPNSMKDGPNKTIWGREQKEWLFRTVKASDATWKVVISPTPIVGPDRANKADNHANDTFKHEGDEIRAFFKEHAPKNHFTMCGDRHWQYHSVHPDTGLNEFSVGAASDQHAGGSPGEDKTYHKFHRVKGGFASVVAGEKSIVFRHHDVLGKVVYSVEVKR
jgi:alkaline phosphatase D